MLSSPGVAGARVGMKKSPALLDEGPACSVDLRRLAQAGHASGFLPGRVDNHAIDREHRVHLKVLDAISSGLVIPVVIPSVIGAG